MFQIGSVALNWQVYNINCGRIKSFNWETGPFDMLHQERILTSPTNYFFLVQKWWVNTACVAN